MTPEQFITKWKAVELNERSAAQSHFNDLCRMLDEPGPTDADPKGDWYCFERGATKTTGGDGWADVWKRGHFGWEYKGKRKDLNQAFAQLQQYALALENPPLLVVCDLDIFRIHTNWTNSASETHVFALDDLRDPTVRQKLKWVLSDPERLKPGKTRQDLTQDAAAEFAKLAQRLRDCGHHPVTVAHFVNRMIFCMFAEDVNLLPDRLFSHMLKSAVDRPEVFQARAAELFAAMKSGGEAAWKPIAWFNGGLFDDATALPLDRDDIALAIKAADLDWAEIDPSILGTLFERGLDPDKRSQLGAHYTDRSKIMMIIEPVIIRPWLEEWGTAKAEIARQMEAAAVARARRPATQSEAKKVYAAARRAEETALRAARQVFTAFIEKLKAFRVLDPACGSGNFLYLALLALKDIEHRAAIEAEAMGLDRPAPSVGPASVLGIEINTYAAELARVSVWIGEIQWMLRNGFGVSRNPILKPLDNIECRDAIRNPDNTAAPWPRADVIVSNPPYLGAKLMYRKIGKPETQAIRAIYKGRLPGFTDLVCYWLENARALIEAGELTRAGMVTTNSIRKNTNLPVMHRILATTRFYEAWPEQKWTLDGAAVDVSLFCFGQAAGHACRLDGADVPFINPDLTSGLDLTKAGPLAENAGGAFLGIQKSGPFDVPGATARAWMAEPANPNGRTNAEVLKPYWNGDDVTGRPRDMWFIDLPLKLEKAEASLFNSPFHHIATTPDEDGKLVEQLRAELEDRAGPRWWEPHWPRPEMRSRIVGLPRYIVTPETAEHRLFVWLAYPVLPDKNLIVIPRSDDLMFGLLHSRFHAAWALRKGSDLQDRPRYTHTTTFATFPFPAGMTPADDVAAARALPTAAAIEAAAKRLDDLRNGYLYPANLVTYQPEVATGFPNRAIPVSEDAAAALAGRTLTGLYNDPPDWLVEAHRKLDEAVAAAYGWPAAIDQDEALVKLFDLNQERVAAEAARQPRRRRI